MTTIRKIKPNTPDILNRSTARLELRRGDGIIAFVSIDKNFKVAAKIFDISPFGASIALPLSDYRKIRLQSEHIFVHLQLHDQSTVVYAARIVWNSENVTSQRLGIKFDEQISPFPSIHLPKNFEFFSEIPDYYRFMMVIYKPYMFFERCIASIVRISEKIWEIEINDTEIILYRGQQLLIWFLNTNEKESHVTFEVIQLSNFGNNRIRAIMYVHQIETSVQEWMARQLVLNCNFTPQQVRKLGLDVKELSNGFRFRFVKTQQEYEMVLKLRYKAYVEAGKVDPSKTAGDMAAPLDHLSRILVAYHNDKIVASVSISFPDSENLQLDTEKAFTNGYPSKVPKKTDLVEIARLCTDSDYRRTDLLTRMFEYTYKVVVCGDRKFILTSSDNKLWPLYKKLGFKKTGMSYPHPYLGGLIHHIIVGERNQPDYGNKMSKLAWNYLWRDMNDFVIARKLLDVSDFRKIKVFLFKAIGRLFRIRKQTNY
ncbi:MAG: N-acyl amino acid synthase FeeM domain-containing protein [Pseudobdellovibrionaceae bacterium]